MRKIIILAAAMAAFGGAYSAQALVPGLPIMETEVGYGYNTAKDGIHSAHIEIAPIQKIVSVRNTGTGTMAEMKPIFMRNVSWAVYIWASATETIMTEIPKSTG